jgi:glycosyltransferase involved in cell wall biosynthesis
LKQITIDGRQLSYPGTGLALVTAEFLQAFQALGYARYISVFIPHQLDPSIYDLDHCDVRWIPLDYQSRYNTYKHWLARAATVPDYVDRLAWAKAIVKKQKELSPKTQHFIPYLYNYGNLKQNLVLVPDLIYRILREEVIDPSRPFWWNLRHKLPLRTGFRRWEERQVFRAERLVVYSQFVRDYVHHNLIISRDRLNLVPLATPRWIDEKYDPAHNAEIREQYHLPYRFVLYVGGYGTRKNIPMLLRVCGKIHEIDSTFRCVFAGLTEELLQSIFGILIREATSDPSVRASILRLPSPSYRDLASLYRLAEFTVYPSLSEGFGLPILEAAAAEKLCLCGDNSSMKEVQLYPEYRIESDREEQWLEQILYFWQNPQQAQSAGRDCGKLVQRYSWRESAQKLWNLLQN